MTSDQRRCMQRSRFVCRILNFCVKTSHAATETPCLHGGKCGLRSNRFYKVKKVLLQIHLWELESAEVALPLRGEQRVSRRLCRWNESVQTYGNTKKA